MKKPVGCVVKAIGLAILIMMAAVFPFLIIGTRNQARGQAYMKSLSRSDVEQLIARSEALLEKSLGTPDPEKSHHKVEVVYHEGDSSRPIPKEFAHIKVVDIVVTANTVRYVWAGGLAHTDLTVARDETGGWTVDAYFKDGAPIRRLWP